MKVRVWTNSPVGSPNAAIGLKISLADREQFFGVTAPTISIDIEGEIINKTLPKSFWKKCPEIRHQAISSFIKQHGLESWPSGNPPVLFLQPISNGHFRLLLKDGR